MEKKHNNHKIFKPSSLSNTTKTQQHVHLFNAPFYRQMHWTFTKRLIRCKTFFSVVVNVTDRRRLQCCRRRRLFSVYYYYFVFIHSYEIHLIISSISSKKTRKRRDVRRIEGEKCEDMSLCGGESDF